MLRQQLAELVDDRKDRVRAAIHDGATTNLHDLHPGEEPDRASASDGASEVAVEERLAREWRGDVLGGVAGVGHGGESSVCGDNGADMLAGERAGQVAGDEAVHNLHLANMARLLEQVEHRELEDRVVQSPRLHLVDRDLGSIWRPWRFSGSPS